MKAMLADMEIIVIMIVGITGFSRACLKIVQPGTVNFQTGPYYLFMKSGGI